MNKTFCYFAINSPEKELPDKSAVVGQLIVAVKLEMQYCHSRCLERAVNHYGHSLYIFLLFLTHTHAPVYMSGVHMCFLTIR